MTDKTITSKSSMVLNLDADEPNVVEGVVIDTEERRDIVNADVNALDQLPDCARVNPDGSVTLPLMFEISFDVRKDNKVATQTYKSLTFHRLNGAAMRAIGSTSEERKAAVAFAKSCRIADVVMFRIYDEMDMADIANAGRVLNHFLTSGPTTPSK